MKHPTLPLLCATLLLAATASAQPAKDAPDQLTLGIIETEAATFPEALRNGPVLAGDARIVIDVNEKGQLTDWLVTAYSRKEFADAAVEILRRWRYTPPSVNGTPWACVREVHFDYERTGVVVNFVGTELMSSRMDEMMAGRDAYRTYALRELDRTPTPIALVQPASPAPDPTGAEHTVTVEFYIDEQGRTRLPSVGRTEADSLYATYALDAVRQWRFEPPLCKGRPVMVLIRQQIRFHAKK